MLEYIYNFVQYFIKEMSDVKYFGLYNSQILNTNNGTLNYPCVLLDMSVSNDIKQYTNKAQVMEVLIDLYTGVEITADIADNDILREKSLQLMKITDTLFSTLEGKNGKCMSTFNIEDKYFAHSIHRYGVQLINYNGLIKTSKTTFKLRIADLSAMPSYDIINFLNLELDTQLKKQI